jgi:hypothetical protein
MRLRRKAVWMAVWTGFPVFPPPRERFADSPRAGDARPEEATVHASRGRTERAPYDASGSAEVVAVRSNGQRA